MIHAATLIRDGRRSHFESIRAYLTVISPVEITVRLSRKPNGNTEQALDLPAAAGVVLDGVLVEDVTTITLSGPTGTICQVSAEEVVS